MYYTSFSIKTRFLSRIKGKDLTQPSELTLQAEIEAKPSGAFNSIISDLSQITAINPANCLVKQ